jgi:hypothetical protein
MNTDPSLTQYLDQPETDFNANGTISPSGWMHLAVLYGLSTEHVSHHDDWGTDPDGKPRVTTASVVYRARYLLLPTGHPLVKEGPEKPKPSHATWISGEGSGVGVFNPPHYLHPEEYASALAKAGAIRKVLKKIIYKSDNVSMDAMRNCESCGLLVHSSIEPTRGKHH